METTYTVGVVAASMPQGGMNFGDARLGGSSRIASVFVESWNHHRVGTEADRRGRGGMRFGLVRRGTAPRCTLCHVLLGLVALGYVTAMLCLLRCVFKPSPCRHGAGSTPAAWDVFRHGSVSYGQLVLALASWFPVFLVGSSLCTARFVFSAIAVGAVRLRRLVAGCVWLRPGSARYGGASPVLARINPPS
jgi:hypothetical protein